MRWSSDPSPPMLRRHRAAGGRVGEAWRTLLVGPQKPRGTLKLISLGPTPPTGTLALLP